MADKQKLQIDIVSDVMCPWCAIGYSQLLTALDKTGTDYELKWHPFELNPEMPPEGQDLREHVAEKYGTTPEQSVQARKNMTALGKEVGFDFNYVPDMRMHNTFNTHQLIHWADQQGRGHDLKMAFLDAHFRDTRNLSDDAVLADVAAEIGLDRNEAVAVLEDQRFADDVRAHEHFWIKNGIQGVPSVIFNERHLVTGAQGVENYTSILDQLAAMKD